MSTDTRTRPVHHSSFLAAIGRRWPIAVGLLAAVASLAGGADRQALTMIVVIAASCYVAAAAFSRPWMAWAWIVPATLAVVAARLLGLDPTAVNAVLGAVLVAVGLVRGAARPGLRLETLGFLAYGLLVVVAVLLGPSAGLALAAVVLIAHGVWDVWHLRRHRDLVSPSLAEACIALDVPLGVAALVGAFLL